MKEIYDFARQHPDAPAFGHQDLIYSCGWVCHMCNWTIDIKYQNLMDPNMLLKHANIKHGIEFGTHDWEMLMTSAMFIHRPTDNGRVPVQLVIPPVVSPRTVPIAGSPGRTSAVQGQENGHGMEERESLEEVEEYNLAVLQPVGPIPPPHAYHIQRFAQHSLNPCATLGSGPFEAAEHPVIKSFPDIHAMVSSFHTTSGAVERLAAIVDGTQTQLADDPKSVHSRKSITTLPDKGELSTPHEIGRQSVVLGTWHTSGPGGNGAADQDNRSLSTSQANYPFSIDEVTVAQTQAHGQTPGLGTNGGTNKENQKPDGNVETSRGNVKASDRNSKTMNCAPVNPEFDRAIYSSPPNLSTNAMIGMQDYLPKFKDLLCEPHADFHAPYKQIENPLILAERGEQPPKADPTHFQLMDGSVFNPQSYEPERFGGYSELPLTEARRMNDERVIANQSRRAQDGPKYNGPPHDPKRHIAVYSQDYLNSLSGYQIAKLRDHHLVHNSEPGQPLQGFNMGARISTTAPAEGSLVVDPDHRTLTPGRYDKEQIEIGKRVNESTDSRKSYVVGPDAKWSNACLDKIREGEDSNWRA